MNITFRANGIKTISSGLTTLVLAGVLTLAPATVGFGSFDDAAYAQGKSGDKGNKGGNKGGSNKGSDRGDKGSDRGNKGGDRGDKKAGGKKGGVDKASRSKGGGNRSVSLGGGKKFKETEVGRTLNGIFGKKKTKAVRTTPKTTEKIASVKPKAKPANASVDAFGLHPSEKKALNAKVAPQAIANKIAHQNWNGISGEYAQLDLLARAGTEPEDLSPEDIAALQSLGIEPGNLIEPDYQEFVDTMFEGDYPEDAAFDVIENEDGDLEVACSNCDELINPDTGEPYTDEQIDEINMAAQDELDMFKEEQDGILEAERENLDPIYDAAEQTLLARTKQDIPEVEGYRWLDGVAEHLGVERPQDLTDFQSPVAEPVETASAE